MAKHCITHVFVLLVILFAFNTLANAVNPKVNFNGDRQADVFLYNIFTGQVSAKLIGDSGVLQNVSYPTVAPSTGWKPIALSDFNGDGRTDIFWYRPQDGALAVWLLNGSQLLQNTGITTVSPSQWIPVDFKDFNGDGRTDILWYKRQNGALAVWLLNGSKVLKTSGLGGLLPSQGWTPVDSKDFNGDGRTDVLWYNTLTGGLTVWLTNGSQVIYKAPLGGLQRSQGWTPVDSKDFNGDGRTDVLWYNTLTGGLTVWLTNGSQVVYQGSLGSLPPNTGWAPTGSGDFNGDGLTDVLWRNAITGELSVWLINGGQVLHKASLKTVPPNSGLALVGFDDFNGDGKTDLLWRDIFSNGISAWLLNGSSIIPQSYASVPPSSVWQVTVPR